MQFYVRFCSEDLTEDQYIGPFDSESDAEDYADDENNRLASAGIPGWRASYSLSY